MIKNTKKFLLSTILGLGLTITVAQADTPKSKEAIMSKTQEKFIKTQDVPGEVGKSVEPIAKAEASANAVAPTLKISGFTSVNLWGVNQSNRTNGKGAGYHLANDTSEIYFIVSGRSESNLGYKYQLTFETIPGQGKLHISQNFIELQKGVTVQLGAAPDVTRTILQDGSRLMGGVGGFSGFYSRVFNVSDGVVNGFRALGETKYATKIVIFSPDWEGFRLAFDFTPNTQHFGSEGLNTQGISGTHTAPGNSTGIYPSSAAANSPFGVHSTAFGALYNRAWGTWNLKMSALGIFDRSYVAATSKNGYYRTRVRGVQSYQLGSIIGYGKFQVGGGWLDNGRSRLPYNSNLNIAGVSMGNSWQGNSGKAWNLAANYVDGAYQFAIGHQNAFRKTDAVNKATSSVTSATFGVTPLQGLKLYVEADYIKTKTNASSVALAQAFNNSTASKYTLATGNNKGLVTLTGISLSF